MLVIYTQPLVSLIYTQPLVSLIYTQPPVLVIYTQPLVSSIYTQPLVLVIYTQPLVLVIYTQPPELVIYTQPLVSSIYTQPLVLVIYTQPLVLVIYTQPLVLVIYTQPLVLVIYTQPLVLVIYTQPLLLNIYNQPPVHVLSTYRRPLVSSIYNQPPVLIIYSQREGKGLASVHTQAVSRRDYNFGLFHEDGRSKLLWTASRPVVSVSTNEAIELLEHCDDIVICVGGQRFYRTNPSVLQEDIRQIKAVALKIGTHVTFCNVPDTLWRTQSRRKREHSMLKRQQFNCAIDAAAKGNKFIAVVDLEKLFADHGCPPRNGKEWFHRDGLHPNTAGTITVESCICK